MILYKNLVFDEFGFVIINIKNSKVSISKFKNGNFFITSRELIDDYREAKSIEELNLILISLQIQTKDQVLDKILDYGIDSITKQEIEILNN